MATIITRLYETKTRADEVVSKLNSEEYTNRDVDVIAGAPAPSSDGDAPPVQDTASIVAQITDAGVYPSAAKRLADRVAAGNALVVVRAPFGAANRATTIVDEFQPIDSGIHSQDTYSTVSTPTNIMKSPARPAILLDSDQKVLTGDTLPASTESGTPFSSMTGMPTVLEPKHRDSVIRSRTTPFSSILGLALLTKRRTRSSVIRDNPAPFSKMFGMPTIIRRKS